MSYRGRLIHPLVAVIGQYDTTATNAAARYDRDFREPGRLAKGTMARVEKPERLRLPAQIEPDVGEQQRQVATGNDPQLAYKITLHFADLEVRGLVDSKGNAKINLGDRLVQIENVAGQVLWTPPQEMLCVFVEPRGFGLGGARNLLVLTFRDETMR